jgi:hypothetical protein
VSIVELKVSRWVGLLSSSRVLLAIFLRPKSPFGDFLRTITAMVRKKVIRDDLDTY